MENDKYLSSDLSSPIDFRLKNSFVTWKPALITQNALEDLSKFMFTQKTTMF